MLIILHGSMGLVQAPRFHLFLMVPIGIFLVDRLITISRSKVQIAVVKSEPLPSSKRVNTKITLQLISLQQYLEKKICQKLIIAFLLARFTNHVT